jgi:uncharacterized protein (TIGR00251 family)
MESTPFSEHPDGTLIDVWVVPGASHTKIAGWHDGALKVRVAAPPEGGKANRALLDLLGRITQARGARLVRGARSRRKQVLLEAVTPRRAAQLLTK